MKVLFVGDVHNHTYMFNDIQRLDKEHNFDKIIFLADADPDKQVGLSGLVEIL